jgi:hypothetical protein
MGKFTFGLFGLMTMSLLVIANHAATQESEVRSGQRAEQADKPSLTKWIDGRFQNYHEEEGLRSAGVVGDAAFLRRVHLDLAGRIPSVSQLRDFTTDTNPNKRLAEIDRLLESERFGEHMARIWRRVLIPASTPNPVGTAGLERWLEEQLDENIGFDQIARELITAGGAEFRIQEDSSDEAESMRNQMTSPVSYLASTGGQPAEMASSVSRVFLGVKLECAMCHNHPFSDWSQDDFWGVAAFFSGAQLRNGPQLDSQQQTTTMDRRSTTVNDTEGQSYSISLPWSDDAVDVPEDQLPRQFFARWATSKKNPHFSATMVNRVWQHLCGDGLTESVEDLDLAPERERAIILDDLAVKFSESNFDMRALVRAICASEHYQRPSDRVRKSTFVGPRPLKVLTPEQLFDSLEVALALPISRIDRGPRFNGLRDALVARMEEALGNSPDDFRSGIPQALTLMNGTITANATDLQKSKTLKAVVGAPFLNSDEKISTLFLATIGREPSDLELATFVEQVESKSNEEEKGEAMAAILWALINSPEFVLVR